MSAIAPPRSIAEPSWKHGVEIRGAELNLFVGPAGLGLGQEQQLERLVDMGRHRLAGRDAGLFQRRLEPAGGPDLLPVARQHRMRLEPVERQQAEPVGDRGALSLVGA